MTNLETKEEIIRNAVGYDELADYLCAEGGHKIAVYADGSVAVGESVGMEIAVEERPIAVIKCPGINQLETTYYTDGWTEYNEKTGRYKTFDGKELDFEDCVRECCSDGDESAGLEALIQELIEDLDENQWDHAG